MAAYSLQAPRMAWTEEEDQTLRAAVARYGIKRWAQIAALLPGRTSKACSHRWRTYLQPGVMHTSTNPFTEWEVAVVKEAHKVLGNNWSAIARMLPGRTNAAVKNFWYAYKRRSQRGRKGYSYSPSRQQPSSAAATARAAAAATGETKGPGAACGTVEASADLDTGDDAEDGFFDSEAEDAEGTDMADDLDGEEDEEEEEEEEEDYEDGYEFDYGLGGEDGDITTGIGGYSLVGGAATWDPAGLVASAGGGAAAVADPSSAAGTTGAAALQHLVHPHSSTSQLQQQQQQQQHMMFQADAAAVTGCVGAFSGSTAQGASQPWLPVSNVAAGASAVNHQQHGLPYGPRSSSNHSWSGCAQQAAATAATAAGAVTQGGNAVSMTGEVTVLGLDLGGPVGAAPSGAPAAQNAVAMQHNLTPGTTAATAATAAAGAAGAAWGRVKPNRLSSSGLVETFGPAGRISARHINMSLLPDHLSSFGPAGCFSDFTARCITTTQSAAAAAAAAAAKQGLATDFSTPKDAALPASGTSCQPVAGAFAAQSNTAPGGTGEHFTGFGSNGLTGCELKWPVMQQVFHLEAGLDSLQMQHRLFDDPVRQDHPAAAMAAAGLDAMHGHAALPRPMFARPSLCSDAGTPPAPMFTHTDDLQGRSAAGAVATAPGSASEDGAAAATTPAATEVRLSVDAASGYKYPQQQQQQHPQVHLQLLPELHQPPQQQQHQQQQQQQQQQHMVLSRGHGSGDYASSSGTHQAFRSACTNQKWRMCLDLSDEGLAAAADQPVRQDGGAVAAGQ